MDKQKVTSTLSLFMRIPSRTTILTLAIFMPSIILVGHFVYGHIGWNIYISFTEWLGLLPRYDFVGFK